jgi:hypothetical protein
VKTAIGEMQLVELGEKSLPMEMLPVKKNSWLVGEREKEKERESVCLPPMKNEREREKDAGWRRRHW